MRNISTAEATLIASGSYSIQYRFWIRNAANSAWVEYTDWVQKLSWDEDIDNPVMGLSADLMFRDGSTNLSPLVGSGLPIDLGRQCYLEVGYASPVGGTVATWHNVFQGRIDYVDPNKYNTMRLEARDLGGALMDAFVEEVRPYGSAGGTAMEVVMQAILDDWAPGVTLFVPTSPSALLGVYNQRKTPVLQALKDLALQIGWTIGYRWDSGTSQWRLTLADPNRTISTPMYTLSSDLILSLNKVALDSSSVRNVIKGSCGPLTGRIVTTVSDSTSISRYTRKYMDLPELEDSVIDTLAELQRYLNSALADLKDPKTELEAELHLWPWAQLNDYYEFSANNINFDTAQRAAVLGIKHSIADKKYRTSFTLRGQPAGAYNNWLGGDGGRPGNPPPNETDPLPAPGGFTSTFTGRDALFGWNPVLDAVEYRVEVYTLGVLRRTETVPTPSYIYTFEANRADAGTPQPSVQILVRSVRASGLASTTGSHTATNLAPSAPLSVTLDPSRGAIRASVPEPTFGDYLRTEWQCAADSGFTTSLEDGPSGASWREVLVPNQPPPNTTWVRARSVDLFGQASAWTSSNAALQPLTSAYLDFLIGGVNLLKNAGFEYNQGGPDLGDDWSTYFNAFATVPFYSLNAGGVLGAQFQRMTSPFSGGVGQVGVQQLIGAGGGIVANYPYTLSAFVNLTFTAAHSLRFYVDWLNSSGSLISSTAQFVATGPISGVGWVRYNATFTSPATAARARVYIWAEGSSGTASFDLDMVMFEPGEKPTFYQESAVFGNLGARSLRAVDFAAITATLGAGPNRTGLDQRGIRVFNGSSVEKVALGNMNGLQRGSTTWGNVPGLWVGPGANVYLHDFPFVLASGVATFSFGTYSSFAGDSTTSQNRQTISVTVPSTVLVAGRKVLLIVSVSRIIPGALEILNQYLELFFTCSENGTPIGVDVMSFTGTGSTLSAFSLVCTAAWRNTSTSTQTFSPTVSVGWSLVEVPA